MFASRTRWSLVPNPLSRRIQECRRRGLPLLDLTESNPTRCGFAYDAEAILGALRDRGALLYEPEPQGLLSAREAVARYYAERGVAVDPERIFLTTSTSEAYSYVFRLLADPGDFVLVPQPSYPLLEFLAGLNDAQLVPYPLTYHQGWGIDLQTLEALLAPRSVPDGAGPRARAILVVHPNNPTGSYVRRGELDFLGCACEQRNLALVSDEVFADYALTPDEQRVVSFAGASQALTFTLSGLSKISALPQMKLAWMVVSGPPNDWREAVARLEVIADTYLSVSAPQARALPAWLESRRALQPQILERIRSNLRWLDTRLTADLPVSRLHVEGGWYAILRVPSHRSDEEWAMDLVSQDGVIVHPGHFFDFASEGHLVVSLLPSPEVFQQGILKVLTRVSRA